MPKISVVMSVYNEPVEWMKQAIDSILNQTFSDFEFIIINDKPDRVENKQLLDEYASKDPRIVIITNEQNIGLTKSLNKGLLISQGEYIARMDADDISKSDRLEKTIYFFTVNPNIDFCSTLFSTIDENGNIKEINACGRFTDISFIYRMNPIGHSSVMFRSKLLKLRTPLYNENFRYEQDYELWSFLCKKGVCMSILKECLVLYRISPMQISNTKKRNRQFSAQKVRFDLITNYLIEHQIITYRETGNISQYLEKIELLDNKRDENIKKVLNIILFVLYYELVKYDFSYIIKYLFNKNFYIYKFSFKDSINIFLSRMYKENHLIQLN